MFKKFLQNKEKVLTSGVSCVILITNKGKSKLPINFKEIVMISMNKTAVVFGTFAPLHRGHIDLITRAKRECKKVIVIVSGYQGDRGDVIGLNLERRFRYVRKTFANDNLVSVVSLDETNIPRYPAGWDKWMEKVEGLIESEDVVFYVSEQEYAEELSARGYQYKLTNRNFGISATMIRENPAQHWNFIAQSFKGPFTKKVLILGSASNGKTTLANDLGRFFSAPVSLEYARQYELENNVTDKELTPTDFFYFLLGQFDQTSKLIDGDTNKGLVIADTDAVVTKAYFDYYVGGQSGADVDAVNHLYQSLVSKEKWDLIIFVEPTGDYVDDGFRDMEMAAEGIRTKFSMDLMKLLSIDILRHKPCLTIVLKGNYLENYNKALNAIKDIYKEC